jgi:hypothetical protein
MLEKAVRICDATTANQQDSTSFHESAKIFHLRLHAAVGIMGFHGTSCANR